MAEQHPSEGSSRENFSGEGSDSIVELNIKTLDSQIYSFRVEKNIPVSGFKEKIANEIGIPVGQQRLIFRGRVLKDDHLLSEYQVENGHTLHLVARQPGPAQPSPETSTGGTNRINGDRATEANSGALPHRIGQISHSVVLGTFNVGDQTEGVVPDLTRVIGAVLNSIGIGGQTPTNGISGMQSSTFPNVSTQASQGNETGGLLGGQRQAGNQTQSGQPLPDQSFQFPPQGVQIPLTTAVPLPSLHSPIPDALTTLTEFMTRMEQALSQNGHQSNSSSTTSGDLPRTELPTNARGSPTPEALSIVLRHAERLLSGPTVAALSHIAGRLEQEGASTDISIRRQIFTESAQVGLAMQHLGALFLELGRTILTLRMAQSPAEASVSAGPAVYISSTGPNPIMVQPFPLQTNSLFSGSSPSSNPMPFGPVGSGNAPRHVNIHIHAGTALAPIVSPMGTRATNGEETLGEQGNGTGSGGSGPVHMLPLRNVIAAAVPSRSTGVAVSNASQSGLGVSSSPRPSESVSLSSAIAEINSQLRNSVGSMQEPGSGTIESVTNNDAGTDQANSMVANEVGNLSASVTGVMTESDVERTRDECDQTSNSEAKESLSSSRDVPSCSVGHTSEETSLKLEGTSNNIQSSSEKPDLLEGAKAPLGLGLGGLERKRRTKQPKSPIRSGDSEINNIPLDQNTNIKANGRQLLQSLASRSSGTSRTGANNPPPGEKTSSIERNTEVRTLGDQGSDGQIDAADIMSQVLHSPAVNGLLAGVSEQTGVGSPNVLRNMLQQLTQNPQIMNSVSQIAQQVDGQDLGNMFSGLGRGQGGGIDLSRMMQQMMPVVSQVLGQRSATSPLFPASESGIQLQHNDRSSSRFEKPNDQNSQINLQEVVQRIEHSNSLRDVFGAVVENAVRLNGIGGSSEETLHGLSNDQDLASEYIEMLQRDIRRRLQGGSDQSE